VDRSVLRRRTLAPLGALGAAAALIGAVVMCATPSATAAATASAGAASSSSGVGSRAAFDVSPAVAVVPQATQAPATAQVWLTDPGSDARLARQPDLVYEDGTAGPGVAISVDPDVEHQTMVGFGASLTDSSAALIAASPQRNAIMSALFSPTDGIGLSWLRQPIGSSDYTSQGFYSYDDVEDPTTQTDSGFSRFTLDRDAEGTLPLVAQALALNPGITVMLTPWSAPAWMKSNHSMVGGTLGAGWTTAYARYLVKTVQAYEARGVPVSYLSVQNEPDYSPAAYPGMKLTAQQEIDIIKAVGPQLAASGLTTKILALDHNWDLESYARTVLSDPGASQYVAGTAWHGYNDDDPATPENDFAAMSRIHDEFGKETLFTEASGWVDPANHGDVFRSTLWWHTHFFGIQAMRSWSQSMSLWNMALDESYGPRPPGVCESCTGVLTVRADGSFTPNAEYYALGHFSKFVRPGARRIDSDETDLLETVAFKNPDGSIVLVAHTLGGSAEQLTVTLDGRHVTWTLPYDGVATIVLAGPTATDPGDGGTTTPQSFSVVAAPRVTGTAKVGARLSATPGTYSVGGVATSYQWLRRGAAIVGATSSSYTPTVKDLGAGLSVKVTASRSGYRTMTAVSTATAPVARGTVAVRKKPAVTAKVKGHDRAVKKAKVRTRLTVSRGTYGVAGTVVTYRWLRGGRAIKHATKARYTLTKKDRGKKVRVRVTVRKSGYTTRTVLSRTVRVR